MSDLGDVVECSWCGDRIMFLRHPRTLKIAPIDFEPNPDGNIAVDRAGGTYQVLGKKVPTLDDPEPAVDRHMNHYATCKNVTRARTKGQILPPPDTVPPPEPDPLPADRLADRAQAAREALARGNPSF